jgi:hypothetical protein
LPTIVIFFGFVILAKFSINLSRYLACNRYRKIYNSYLEKPGWKIEEIQPQIAKLFEEAGVGDSFVPFVEPVGYGHIMTANVSALENIAVRRQDVVLNIISMFHRAKGIYSSRIIDSINPLYWIMFVIFLPKNIVQYLGASPESTFTRSVQVIYWFVAGIVGFLLTVFNNEISVYVKRILFDALGIK